MRADFEGQYSILGRNMDQKRRITSAGLKQRNGLAESRNGKMPRARLFLLAICCFGLQAAMGQEPVGATDYFRMEIHVFEGGHERVETEPESRPELVDRALDQVGRLLGYTHFRPVDRITWLVRAQGDMDRFLDIPERWWSLAEDTNISFKLLYNQSERFLSLNDFRFMVKQVPKLHTTVGVHDGGAAVLGHSKIDSRQNDILFILTLEVRATPFEGQDERAIFTVTGTHHHEH